MEKDAQGFWMILFIWLDLYQICEYDLTSMYWLSFMRKTHKKLSQR